ncbi:HNH endonuclease [Brachybacterium sp. GCM10030267]|uniref:HNH endonuclease n=1 Tax=unclassified Brachybacterium TaxID=2623841 RepID=UPI003623265A
MTTSEPGQPGRDQTAGGYSERLVETVRAGGPRRLATELGDIVYLLSSLATEPGEIFEPGTHPATEFRDVIGRIHEATGALDALEARAVVALADSLKRDRHAEAAADAANEPGAAPSDRVLDKQAERTAAREVSMVTRRSPSTSGRTVASSRRLVESMPNILEALATAQVSSKAAQATATSVAPLSPTQREKVDEHLGERLPDLDAAGPERWKREVDAVIEEADAGGEERRHLTSRQKRYVTVRRGEHGMATVSARVPALDAAKIRKRLSLDAERQRADGDKRGHAAIQADSFVATLLGDDGAMESDSLDIGVMITDRALLHPHSGDLARIEGYGPVPAEAIREELRTLFRPPGEGARDALGPDGPELRAVLRRLYTHPTTGELVGVDSVARTFPKALARFVLWRDATCRGPFCDAPIRQTDHITPHATGGHTCLENGQGLCALCNGKEQQLRSVRRDPGAPGHRVTWTTRTGTTRTTTAEALTRPIPDRAPAGSVRSAKAAAERAKTGKTRKARPRNGRRPRPRLRQRLKAPRSDDQRTDDRRTQGPGRRREHARRSPHRNRRRTRIGRAARGRGPRA